MPPSLALAACCKASPARAAFMALMPVEMTLLVAVAEATAVAPVTLPVNAPAAGRFSNFSVALLIALYTASPASYAATVGAATSAAIPLAAAAAAPAEEPVIRATPPAAPESRATFVPAVSRSFVCPVASGSNSDVRSPAAAAVAIPLTVSFAESIRTPRPPVVVFFVSSE